MSNEDFIKAFEKVLKFVQDLKKSNEREFILMHSAIQMLSEKVKSDASTEMSNSKKTMMDYCMKEMAKMQKEMDKMSKEQMDGMKFIYDKSSNLKADEPKIVNDVLAQIKLPEQKEIILDTPIEIRDKLEVLPEEEKLVIDAIKGLREELGKIKKSQTTNIPMGIGNSRGTVKVYDLSGELNGVLKTFSLPAFWRVLTVDLSSFPNALRPTTDFTTDASLMQITFTSQIDAATSLATGQTCIVTYAEN